MTEKRTIFMFPLNGKSRRASRAIAAAATAALLAANSAPDASAANITPITITGYNVDDIAETTTVASSVTGYFDANNGYAFYTAGLTTVGGLPASGTITSAANAATTFQLAAFTGSNALELNVGSNTRAPLTTTGTLTLATPAAYSTIALLNGAGNGAASITYSLAFADGNTATGAFTAADWYNGSPYAIGGLGRISYTGTFDTGGVSANNPRLYENDITIPSAEAQVKLNSISFTDKNTTGSQWSVFALSGAASAAPVIYTGADPSTPGTFDTTSQNFSANGTAASFTTGAAAIFDDTATGPTTVTVASGGVAPASLTFNNSSGGKSYVFNGGPVTSGTVTIAGGGSVTFNNANTFTGATTISSGNLTIGSGGAIASTSITVGNNSSLTVALGGSIAGTPALTDNGTVTFNNPTRALASLAGNGALFLNGTALTIAASTYTGTVSGNATSSLTLTGNTYTVTNPNQLQVPTVNLTGGTLVVNDASGSTGLFGTVPVVTNLSGGSISGSGTYAGTINVAAAGGTITSTASNALTLNGPVNAAGPVTYVNSSNSVVNLYAPGTGTGLASVVGTAGALDLNYVRLFTDNGFSTQAGLSISASPSGSATYVDLNGHNQTVTFLTGSASGGQSGLNSFGGNSILTISNGNNGTSPAYSNVTITGNIAVVKTGLGNQVFANANSYSNGTTITQGTLTTLNTAAAGTGTITLNGGTFAPAGLQSVTSVSGFSSFVGQGLNINANTSAPPIITPTQLTLTVNNPHATASAFTATAVPISLATGFTVSFLYTPNDPANTSGYLADGLAFVLQNDPRGSAALGDGGGALGYSGTSTVNTPIAKSFAAGLDIYKYNYGVNDVVFGTNGTLGTPVTSTSVVVNAQPDQVKIVYNAATSLITETITNANTPTASYTTTYGVNLLNLLGGTTAYVGFTGGEGDGAAQQLVSNFTLSNMVNVPTTKTNPIVAATNTSSIISTAVLPGSTFQQLGTLTLNPGSTVKLVTTGSNATSRSVVSTPTLTFVPDPVTNLITATLDITNGDLDLPNTDIATVTALVQSGYNLKGGANFKGPGITSSTAANDSTHTTAVGVIADTVNGTQMYGTGTTLGLFDGANPGAGDVLVKYTYFGDANLDGKVDGSDYTLIDNGFNQNLTGWYNGDFNYDGKVDGVGLHADRQRVQHAGRGAGRQQHGVVRRFDGPNRRNVGGPRTGFDRTGRTDVARPARPSAQVRSAT